MDWAKPTRILLRSMIKESFPELSVKRIVLWSFGLGPFWGTSWWLLPWVRIIIVTHKSRDISHMALMGLLAHELSHQVVYRRYFWIRYVFRTPWIYIFRKDLIKGEEAQVDKVVMERGFGRHLCVLTKIIDQDPDHERVKKYYFTPTEIEAYCQENKFKF